MKETGGSLFLGSLVYGLGLSIGLALAAVFVIYVGLKMFGWWATLEADKAEKEAEKQALKDMLAERMRKSRPTD